MANGTDLRSLAVTEPPTCLHTVWQEFASVDPRKTPQSNFLKGVKWSPDGVCLLTASDDNCLRIFDLPQDLYQQEWQQQRPFDDVSGESLPLAPVANAADEVDGGGGGDGGGGRVLGGGDGDDSLSVGLAVEECEALYDFCWFPAMASLDPVSCCFATTCRANPIHLWDACSGQLRCSYRVYDAADEVTAAYSVAFHPDGTRLVSGHNKAIHVFDVTRPGRDYSTIVTHRRKQGGQPGIISCFSFNPDRSGLLAAGSYNGSVGLYLQGTREALAVMEGGHTGGVTQVMFSPDGNYLYTGARRDPYLLCWDVRHTMNALYSMERDSGGTNQRMQFDIEPCGRHLVTGGQDGVVRFFDLRDGQPAGQFVAAADTINGVSVHPAGLPLLATSSGQRRFEWPLPRGGGRGGGEHEHGASSSGTSSSGSGSSSDEDGGGGGGGAAGGGGGGGGDGRGRVVGGSGGGAAENCLRLWGLRSVPLDYGGGAYEAVEEGAAAAYLAVGEGAAAAYEAIGEGAAAAAAAVVLDVAEMAVEVGGGGGDEDEGQQQWV